MRFGPWKRRFAILETSRPVNTTLAHPFDFIGDEGAQPRMAPKTRPTEKFAAAVGKCSPEVIVTVSRCLRNINDTVVERGVWEMHCRGL
jgi:hypothetical protein